MARLTDRELDVIRQARSANWREWSEIDILLLQARRQRSEMIARMIARGCNGLVRVTGLATLARIFAERVARPARKWFLRRRTIALLQRLDDNLLLDIGLTRGEIDRAATTLVEAKMPAPAQHTALPGAAWLARVGLWLRKRTAIRELGALDDRLLADIGLVRGDIPSVVEGLMPAAHAPSRLAAPLARVRRAWDKAAATAAPLTAGFRRWLARRATVRQLEALDDRMLADIGLVRGDIGDFVTREGEGRFSAAGTPTLEQSNYWDSVVRALRQWDLSRQAAGQMARLDADTLSDLGYVKGDVDWVPEVMAQRKLDSHKAA